MEKLFEEAMKSILKQIKDGTPSDDAMRYTQAACNLANTRVALSNISK